MQRYDDGGVLGALRLVDAGGVGELQLIDFAEIVIDQFPIESGAEEALLDIDFLNAPEIAIEDMFL